MDPASLRFLYRQAEGRIGPALWLRASALPIGLALALTAIAFLISPGPRDLASQPFISPSIVAVHAYFIVYGFALFLLAVVQYFVSAKRFRDLGRAPAWAGLLPFLIFLAGAVAWLQPRSGGALPDWCVYPVYAVTLAALAWNVGELGFARGRIGSA